MAEAILEFDAVSKRFDRTITADKLSFAVDRGEFFTLLGPSGSGKSTLLRMVAGLEQPDAGVVRIEGRDVAGVPPWRRNLGMVFQQYAIFPHMTVMQNVGYGLRARGAPAGEIEPRVRELLKLVGLEGLGQKNATLLSGGEQQRVALARALAPRPTLLLLDEPLSALDEKVRREMQTELKHIQRQTGTTFLYVTHDQEEALTMSDRIAVLNLGACVQCDSPEHLFRNPRTRFVASFFRGCNVIEGQLAGFKETLAQVRIGDGELSVPVPAAFKAGIGPVALAIRAERVLIGPSAGNCQVRLQALLREVVYRGTNVDHVLELKDGQRVVATSTRREVEGPGQWVAVGTKFEDVILLDG